LTEIELTDIPFVVAEQGLDADEGLGVLMPMNSELNQDHLKLSAELRGCCAFVEDPQSEKDRRVQDVEQARKRTAADEQEIRRPEHYSEQLNEFLHNVRRT
jgi:hypothetical protein